MCFVLSKSDTAGFVMHELDVSKIGFVLGVLSKALLVFKYVGGRVSSRQLVIGTNPNKRSPLALMIQEKTSRITKLVVSKHNQKH